MATTLATKLVLDALDMALWQRRPKDVIHHSVYLARLRQPLPGGRRAPLNGFSRRCL
jgi:hypothetical protein